MNTKIAYPDGTTVDAPLPDAPVQPGDIVNFIGLPNPIFGTPIPYLKNLIVSKVVLVKGVSTPDYYRLTAGGDHPVYRAVESAARNFEVRHE